MPNKDDNRISGQGVRTRAQQLAASERDSTSDAESLAALEDGSLSFQDVDEAMLHRCLAAVGVDHVVDVLIHASGQSLNTNEQLRNGENVDRVTGEAIPFTLRSQSVSRGVNRMRWTDGLSWATAAAVVLVAIILFRQSVARTNPEREQVAIINEDQMLKWPGGSLLDSTVVKPLGPAKPKLSQQLPNFDLATGTLGTSQTGRFVQKQLATVIVRSESGWGSGTVISSDGWILTDYDVVASAAQRATVSGHPAVLDIIAARLVDNGIRPQPPVKAILFRADPSHDLALLKLVSLPPPTMEMKFFRMASAVRDGEDCFVIGSQTGGAAWWARSGNTLRQLEFPEGLKGHGADGSDISTLINRERAKVIETDIPVNPGDSGGPLFDAKGGLIGLSFFTPTNPRGRSVGWYISLLPQRNFVEDLPRVPEEVPFDIWTAGLQEAVTLEPELADPDPDGHPTALIYRYVDQAPKDGGHANLQPLALTIFADLSNHAASSNKPDERIPAGLWGMEDRGGFKFDVAVTVRADHVVAVGYPDPSGVVTQIRVGTLADGAKVLWNRSTDGRWNASPSAGHMHLIDPALFSTGENARLRAMLLNLLGKSTGP